MSMPWKLTNEEKNKIYQMYKTGQYTLKQIADLFGVNESAVSYQLTRFFSVDKNKK